MFASFVLNALLTVSAAPALAASTAANTLPAAAASSVSADAAAPLATPQFRRYGLSDGLPSGPIYGAAQGPDGLMWFATSGGLLRYDGVSFTTFRHVAGDPQSMPGGTMYSIFVDRANRVWAGGISNGLIQLDPTTGRFRHWVHDAGVASSLSADEVWSIAQTPDGAIWVATQGGLDRMRADGSGFEKMPLDLGDPRAGTFGPTRALLAEPGGRLWIGAESGLYVREPGGTTRRVPVDPSFHGDADMVWRIDGAGDDIRVAVSGGLLVVAHDGVARPLESQRLSSSRVMSSSRDALGRLWIGTADGVFLQQEHGGLRLIEGQPLLPGGLPGDKTWQTMLDAEGGLWITFDTSSIGYLPPGWNGFTRFTHIPDDPGSLSSIAAAAVHLGRDGGLWIGGDNGWIDKLDMVSGRVQHMVRDIHAQVVSLTEDPRGRLWIDDPPQLHVFDHGKLTSVSLDKAQVTRPVLLCASDDGHIYFASWSQGLFVVDPDSLAIASVPSEPDDEAPPLPDQVTYHAGRLWYANANGLQQVDPRTGKLRFVPGVTREEVLSFAFDANGFWLATWTTLEHYRYAGDRATLDDSITYSPNVFTADLSDLQVDRHGRLWIFGNPGLWEFDQGTRRFTSFGPSQGLSNANFASVTTGATAEGTIFGSNNGGVVAFQPDRLMQAGKTPPPPPLTLAYLNVQRRGEVQDLPLDSDAVRLGWRDRGLRVGVRLASYINPTGNHYRFRLNGFDTGWVNADNRGERDFAGLESGDYTLEVQGTGSAGEWSHLARPLRIHVQAPPWARWWAWLVYVLLLAAVVGLILRGWRRRLAQRHRIQLAEQQRQMAEAASAAKTQFLATLSHEIRTPMTGVMGMAELLLSTPLSAQQHEYTQAMQRSGEMLLKLLNDALDLARIEAGRLELEPAPFDPRQLLEDVAQLEQGLAHHKGLRFVLELADDLPGQLIGDALRIKQVLLNLANNALKFTEQGSVTLRAQWTAAGLLLSVSDTGPGIPEASQVRLFQRFEQEEGPQRRAGSGLGLAICRELVDMMGGSIELESRVAHGSTFRVRLPLAEPEQPQTLPASGAGGQQRMFRLLLVEDDTIVAAVISGLLERQGHTVAHVGNGLAALAELAQAAFDAVLLDLDLPGVDGFQIARLIRQREPAGQRMPIVAVTARSGSEDEMAARAAGMDGFLRKPLSGEQLATMLAQVVDAADAKAAAPA